MALLSFPRGGMFLGKVVFPGSQYLQKHNLQFFFFFGRTLRIPADRCFRTP